jgi:hypothetical protein
LAAGKGASDEHRRAPFEYPAQLGGANAEVRNVMNDGGQQRCPAAVIAEGDGLAVAGHDGTPGGSALALALARIWAAGSRATTGRPNHWVNAGAGSQIEYGACP